MVNHDIQAVSHQALLAHIHTIEDLYCELELDVEAYVDCKKIISEYTMKMKCQSLLNKIEVLRAMGIRYHKYDLIAEDFFALEILKFCSDATEQTTTLLKSVISHIHL